MSRELLHSFTANFQIAQWPLVVGYEAIRRFGDDESGDEAISYSADVFFTSAGFGG